MQLNIQFSRCLWCDERFKEDEPIEFLLNGAMHYECAVRSIVGSLAHLKGQCSCVIPGAEETDPPGMTRREAAIAAYKFHRAQLEYVNLPSKCRDKN
jgi:hypothetical protein